MFVKWRLWKPLVALLLLAGMLLAPAPHTAKATINWRLPFIGSYPISQGCPGGGYTGSYHTNAAYYAIDFAMGRDTKGGIPVYAPTAGTVRYAQFSAYPIGGYGNLVIIEDSDENAHYLAHLAKIYVSADQSVSQGQLIGLSGNTGNGTGTGYHLHYHVQELPWDSTTSTAVDAGDGDLSGITWAETDRCAPSGVDDGQAVGPELSSNPYNYCPDFAANNVTEVKLFDHRSCEGNVLTLSSTGVPYRLYGSFDNRARSIYVPPGKSVYVADDAFDPYSRRICANQDKWDLDVDNYKNIDNNNTGVKVGWQGGSGDNMISWVMAFDEPDCKHNGLPFGQVLAEASRIGFDETDGGVGYLFDPSSTAPSLLVSFSTTEQLPFSVQFNVTVNNTTGSDYYDAMQICVGTTCNETSTLSMSWSWNTYGHDDGLYDVKLRYRTAYDSGNWANAAIIYDGELFLSPNRGSYAPCSSNADGVELTSGSDCVIVTRDLHDLAEVGWGDRSSLQACINGDVVAWLYDGVSDELGNYPGMAYVVDSSACKNLGNNVSSVNLKEVSDPPPPSPWSPFEEDPNTVHLWHMEDSHVDYIANGDTVADTVSSGGQTGTVTTGQWVNGAYGSYGLGFFSANSGRGLTYSTMDVCPMTFEGWIHFVDLNGSGFGRVAGQLSGNGNSGSSKWLLALDNFRPTLSVWWSTGSLSTISFQAIADTNWHYVMATYDCSAKQAALYLDNELVGSFVTPSSWNTGATTFEVGTVGGTDRCNCELDEIRISDVVRVPEWPENPYAGLENPVELLEEPVHLEGNNGSDEVGLPIDENALNGRTMVRVTLDLHGMEPLGGDASALAFDQDSEWQYVGMDDYLDSGFNGEQTFVMPLAHFMDLDPEAAVGDMHIRFWYGSAFEVDVTSVVAYRAGGVELLDELVHLEGNNGSDEIAIPVDENVLNGKDMARVTLNLHGITALSGDASALAFDQDSEWQYVGLSGYVDNGLNGWQTVDVPLADLMDLDPNQPVGDLHLRFWYGSAFEVDIAAVYVYASQ